MRPDGELPPPPSGFELLERGPFLTLNGPIFHRPDAEGASHAFFILNRHANAAGILHGGMLSAFLDSLLGAAISRATGSTPMTVHLSIDFLRMAKRGEWLIGTSQMSHAAGGLAFVNGEAKVGSRLVGRATGVFKMMDRAR